MIKLDVQVYRQRFGRPPRVWCRYHGPDAARQPDCRIGLNRYPVRLEHRGSTVSYHTAEPESGSARHCQLYGNACLRQRSDECDFTDTSTGSPTGWNWTFGDGSLVNATEQNPLHTYTDAGTYTVSLNATNAAGSDMLTKVSYITVSALPSVTEISPDSGSIAGGTSVIITGTGFTSVSAVMFGTTPAASYSVDTPTQISAVSPAHAVGTVNITVTTVTGTSSTSPANEFTFTDSGQPHTDKIGIYQTGSFALDDDASFSSDCRRQGICVRTIRDTGCW